MAMGRDAEKDLAVVLSYLTGRRLSLEEVLAAVEMSRSTYYHRQARGTLITTDTLLRAARNLGFNPIDLLVRFGRIEPSDVAEYMEDGTLPLASTTVRTRPATMKRFRPRTSTNDMRLREDAPSL
ncbi:hypothetical protein ACQI4L_21500 [Mycolicibacterium litorale]|uniref:hypothetical protein n=1 Tax=Mycolicibacterium litorale TaxID=758802 RepID=UPI003CF91FDA